MNLTFMLPCCIVIDFFLNNQPDALIIQILFCYKTLHVSGIFSAHHQEFLTCQRLIFRFTGATREKLSQMSGVRLRHRSLWQRVTYITRWPPLLATHIRVPFGKICERCQEYSCVISMFYVITKKNKRFE
jgi:hypothetical protein